jgi:hypothetical protein
MKKSDKKDVKGVKVVHKVVKAKEGGFVKMKKMSSAGKKGGRGC